MINLGKRSRRPVIGAVVAFTTTAVILAAPGSAGAASTTSTPHPAAASTGARVGSSPAAMAGSIPTAGAASIRSRIEGTDTKTGRRTVRGTFTPGLFKVNPQGNLSVRGTLHTVIRNANGTLVKKGSQSNVWIPVQSINGDSAQPNARNSAAAAAAGACPVLNLVLGPLDLDLLGLQVHLDKVVLNIVAQSGAGNLLGNLLCAVAGLLDGTPLSGLLGQVATLLNSILAILRA